MKLKCFEPRGKPPKSPDYCYSTKVCRGHQHSGQVIPTAEVAEMLQRPGHLCWVFAKMKPGVVGSPESVRVEASLLSSLQ